MKQVQNRLTERAFNFGTGHGQTFQKGEAFSVPADLVLYPVVRITKISVGRVRWWYTFHIKSTFAASEDIEGVGLAGLAPSSFLALS